MYLGVDIGGNNVRLCVYEEKKNVIRLLNVKAFQKLGEAKKEVEKNVCQFITDALKQAAIRIDTIKGIGFSLAACFDRSTGSIICWPNHSLWNGIQFKNLIEQHFSVQVVIEDDANCAALAEQSVGFGRGYSDFAYITLSTGIGCGFILNNALYVGHKGHAGEIGHVQIIENGPRCICGKFGCLQSIASGVQIEKQYNGICKVTSSTNDTYTFEQIVELARQKDKRACELLSKAGLYLGKTISSIGNVLDLPLIIIGGGMVNAGSVLTDPIQQGLQKGITDNHFSLKYSELGTYNGAIGAIANIYKKFTSHRMQKNITIL